MDPGNPKALGLLAIREDKGKPATTLPLLFDRPVFAEGIAFFPPGGDSPYPDAKDSFRIRVSVRDGKGRKTIEDRQWIPKVVVRD